MSKTSGSSVTTTSHDPESWRTLLDPPADETAEEKEERLNAEAEAREVSEHIDAEIERQKQAERRGPKPRKILLLGQSESGKSTTLKNFQIKWDPESFTRERAAWRSVIQLNVVRSIQIILVALGRAQATILQSSNPQASAGSTPTDSTTNPYLDPALYNLQSRLECLKEVERTLTRRLTVPGSGEVEPTVLPTEKSRNALRELAVNSATHWKGALTRPRKTSKASGSSSSFESKVDEPELVEATKVLNHSARDMDSLWRNPAIKRLLSRQNIRLEEMAGFFLDSIERVTSLDYIPSDYDVLRARLKSLGASEHKFNVDKGEVWRVFDIGGHRSLRATWVPYFDDMDAIIFLAPISCFDQMLEEDPKTNRLEDSVNIWTMIVENKLLKDTNMILFLNKFDILRGKLESGIRFADHVVSYGERPNDAENASSYLRKKFGGILKEKSILPRPFYCHLTSVTDIESTNVILSNVKDLLMRRNLSEAALLA